MSTNFDNIPRELRAHDNWVAYQLLPDQETGKTKKLPINAATGKAARCNDPHTWTDFETVRAAVEQYGYDGAGFEFSRSAGLVGIDIDHCYDPEAGCFNGIAQDILERGRGYAEFSPSGTGVHLWFKGKKPEGPLKNTANGVEMYDCSRFFTVTGRPVPGCPAQVGEAPEGFLQWVQEVYLAAGAKVPVTPVSPERMDDNRLLKTAAQGKKGREFKELFMGLWKDRYPSHSEADSALCFQLAYWTGKDKERMDRLFRRSRLMREKWDKRHYSDGRTYGQACLDNAIANTEQVYSPGQKNSSRGSIVEQEGCFYLKAGDSTRLLTDFVIRPVEMVLGQGQTIMTADCVTAARGETFRLDFDSTDFATLRRFKERLNQTTIGLCYFGRECDLETLKKYLYQLDWKGKTGVSALGIHDHRGKKTFVAGKTALAAGGEAVDSLLQLPGAVSLTSDLAEREPLTGEELKALGPDLLAYNEPAKTVSILGWAGCCFLKSTLNSLGKKTPHLFCIGEAGSGKSTTLETVLLPMFGSNRITAATQVTPFTLMKDSASSNLVPIALDEFKPGKMDKKRLFNLSNHFRDSYDGHAGLRGRADLSMTAYDLSAPLLVAGEETTEETAVRERSMELLFSKRDLQEPERREAFQRVKRSQGQLGCFGRLLLEAALKTENDTALAWYQEGSRCFGHSYPDRIVNNLACLYAGLKLAEAAARSLGLSWQEAYRYSFENCLQQLEEAVKNYLLDGRGHALTVVEQSFEVIARMPMDRKNLLAFSEDGSRLYLKLNTIYDEYTRYRRDYSIAGEVLPLAQFRKQLQHTDYFVDDGVQKRINGKNLRCVVVDFKKLCQNLDMSGLEVEAGAFL